MQFDNVKISFMGKEVEGYLEVADKMKQCTYWDCGWCYHPTLDTNVGCYEPIKCKSYKPRSQYVQRRSSRNDCTFINTLGKYSGLTPYKRADDKYAK